MPNRATSLVLFLGSGYSAELGLPTTNALREKLLECSGNDPEVRRREKFISARVSDFWRRVFGWEPGSLTPSLEDHFTQVDLAANSGHHLGGSYSPKKLRAIRRWTIHRVFKLLEIQPTIHSPIEEFLRKIRQRFRVSVVTTNWDIAFERCLDLRKTPFNYGLHAIDVSGRRVATEGIPILKLHGSTNWGYCDCCQKVITLPLGMGQIVVNLRLLLDPDDFRLFKKRSRIATELEQFQVNRCLACPGRMTTRVATFSYRKGLDAPVFQAVWDEARPALAWANRWLFIGYSLPEADIEIRHLLKTTQLARKRPASLSIEVVLKDDPGAAERYARFFGLRDEQVFNCGLGSWINSRLQGYCAK